MRINQVRNIVWREFSTRVKKKAFIITTAIGPLLMLVMMIVPYWFTTSSSSDSTTYKVLALNCEGSEQLFMNSDKLQFDYACTTYDTSFLTSYDGIIDVPNSKWYYTTPNDLVFDYIHARLSLSSCHDIIQIPIIGMERIIRTDQKKGLVRSFFAYGSAILIYFFIFLYGMQVMKGVIEEKNNRIIEVLITIVKPFELMVGKIIGLGLLGLLQFVIWTVLYGLILLFVESKYNLSILSDEKLQSLSSSAQIDTLMDFSALLFSYSSIQWLGVLAWFFVCFVFGYLIFASLFAVVGSASDVDTETQQFIFPITIPLLGTLMFAEQIVNNPTTTLAYFLSYFPLTSSLASALRMEYIIMHSSWLEIITIVLSQFTGFVMITWLASKVYRIGILSYGKKITYSDVVKWTFSKD